MESYRVGETIYYKNLFGRWKPAEIVDIRKVRTINVYGAPGTEFQFIIKTKNKLKFVREDDIF